MSLEAAKRQMSKQLELPLAARGEASRQQQSDEANSAASGPSHPGTDDLMKVVTERSNLHRAMLRVRQNKGGPGVDGMTIDELPKYLAQNEDRLRDQLLAGTYRPSPVRLCEIPKSGGGTRQLGIPTVVDRLVQQALLHVLQPIFDPTFSDHSYGFRPGRSAHGAIREARQLIADGGRVVVDVDLEKFFDRVNHDVLMGRLARRISDKRVLGLVRRFLEAGMMANGVCIERDRGTPQGGPLSPILANVLLDDIDKMLERRGHKFVRYADDLNVYVRSKRAGARVFALLQHAFGRLHLQINIAKSAIASPRDRKFLGYSFWFGPGGVPRPRVAPSSRAKLEDRIREITSRVGGRSMAQVVAQLRAYLPGWKAYFTLAETQTVFAALDKWIRRRLRAVQLHQWCRFGAVYRELKKRGIEPRLAYRTALYRRSWWAFAKSKAMSIALPNEHFDRIGVPRLST